MGRVLDLHYDVPDADFKIIRDILLSQDDKFWMKISELFKYGGAATDKHGHYREWRIRMHPVLSDMLSGFLHDHMGWFDSQTSAIRAITSIGLHVALAVTGAKKRNVATHATHTQFLESLGVLEALQKKVRLASFRDELQEIKNSILSQSTISKRKKFELLEDIDKLEANIAKDIEEE